PVTTPVLHAALPIYQQGVQKPQAQLWQIIHDAGPVEVPESLHRPCTFHVRAGSRLPASRFIASRSALLQRGQLLQPLRFAAEPLDRKSTRLNSSHVS